MMYYWVHCEHRCKWTILKQLGHWCVQTEIIMRVFIATSTKTVKLFVLRCPSCMMWCRSGMPCRLLCLRWCRGLLLSRSCMSKVKLTHQAAGKCGLTQSQNGSGRFSGAWQLDLTSKKWNLIHEGSTLKLKYTTAYLQGSGAVPASTGQVWLQKKWTQQEADIIMLRLIGIYNSS